MPQIFEILFVIANCMNIDFFRKKLDDARKDIEKNRQRELAKGTVQNQVTQYKRSRRKVLEPIFINTAVAT